MDRLWYLITLSLRRGRGPQRIDIYLVVRVSQLRRLLAFLVRLGRVLLLLYALLLSFFLGYLVSLGVETQSVPSDLRTELLTQGIARLLTMVTSMA